MILLLLIMTITFQLCKMIGIITYHDNLFALSCSVEKAYIDCEIVQIPTNYDYKPLAWGIQKDSPFIELFNYYLKDMKEKGTMQQIFEKYESLPQVCPDSSGKAVGMDACFTAFGVLLFGAGISVLLLITEMFADHCKYIDGSILNAYGKVERTLTKDEEIQLLKEEISTLRKKLPYQA